MPDADGSFRGIQVPPLPWKQRFDEGARVRTIAGLGTSSGRLGRVDRASTSGGVYLVEFDDAPGVLVPLVAGHLRPA